MKSVKVAACQVPDVREDRDAALRWMQVHAQQASAEGARPMRAIENVRAICEEHLQGRYELEVVDIYQQPVLAKGEQIVAAPTLIKKLPAPLRRIIGDLSNKERVLIGLDLRLRGEHL